ncbi:glycosyltransferase [Dactylosporangium sp. CS-047395]|uniref:glycosyltransferase n=1 Tax=Dactylosporangium sp. CS-047395 TaxID=3239936 RepID=UPI003D9250F8
MIAATIAEPAVWRRSMLPPDLDLEVIVPAYNEEHRIGPTIAGIATELAAMPLRAGVRVVDNGSCDRTADVVDQFGGYGIPIAVTGCSRRGKGAAVKRGMLESTARFVGFCDADLATDPAEIPAAVHQLEQGWQVVIGSRRCAEGRIAGRQTVVRRLGGAAFRRCTRRYAGEIRDTQCGFKFFDGTAARGLFSTMTLSGFAFDLELVARARMMGLSIKEVGVLWSDRAGSSFDPVRDGLRVAADLWRLHRTTTRPGWGA